MVIGRPVEDVWRLISNMDAYSTAFGEPLGERYRVTSAGPLGLGSIVEANEWTVGQVTEFDPNRAIATSLPAPGREFRHRAMRRATIGHRLEPVASGTRFITWIEVEPNTTANSQLPALRARWRERLRLAAANVKRVMEAT